MGIDKNIAVKKPWEKAWLLVLNSLDAIIHWWSYFKSPDHIFPGEPCGMDIDNGIFVEVSNTFGCVFKEQNNK